MANEDMRCVTSFLKVNDITHQLASPNVHRRNVAERAVSTWTDHFIAGMFTTDPHFDMHL